MTDLALAVAIALSLLALTTTVVVAARRRFAGAASTATQVDDLVLDLSRQTRIWLLAFPIAWIAARSLVMHAAAARTLLLLVRVSLIIQAALWLGVAIDFALKRYHRRIEGDPAASTTLRAFRFASILAVWVVALLMALDNLGVAITPLVTGLGIGGIAVALAVQNILGDLFASLSIVLDKPFVVGDAILVEDMVGIVERIGLKTTRLRSISGEQISLANGQLLQSRIHNFKRMDSRRVVTRIGVVYQTAPRMLERIPVILKESVLATPGVRFERAHFATFGDSAYEFELVYHVQSGDYSAYMDAQQEINLRIVRGFEGEGVEFAYPTRTVIVERH